MEINKDELNNMSEKEIAKILGGGQLKGDAYKLAYSIWFEKWRKNPSRK